MDEEYDSLIENQTWELVPLPPSRKCVHCRWIYQNNMEVDGIISKYTYNLVANGFSQIHGIDNTKAFAPIANMESIRLVLDIVVARHWKVHHMDVKSSFIRRYLVEEIYMDHP